MDEAPSRSPALARTTWLPQPRATRQPHLIHLFALAPVPRHSSLRSAFRTADPTTAGTLGGSQPDRTPPPVRQGLPTESWSSPWLQTTPPARPDRVQRQ